MLFSYLLGMKDERALFCCKIIIFYILLKLISKITLSEWATKDYLKFKRIKFCSKALVVKMEWRWIGWSLTEIKVLLKLNHLSQRSEAQWKEIILLQKSISVRLCDRIPFFHCIEWQECPNQCTVSKSDRKDNVLGMEHNSLALIWNILI